MKAELTKELNKIITMLVNKEYEKFTDVIDCQGLSSNDISTIIEDFGETLIIPNIEDLEQVNIIDVEENEWAIDFDLWTKESGKSDLTIQLTVKKNLDNSLNVEFDDIHVL
jgi:hypothetical protein